MTDTADLPREFTAKCGCVFPVTWWTPRGVITDCDVDMSRKIKPCDKHPSWLKMRPVWSRSRTLLQMQYCQAVTDGGITDVKIKG